MANLKELMKTLWFCPAPGRDNEWGLPCVIWGPPGVGKTESLESLASESGFEWLEPLIPGEAGEGAFGLIPNIKDDVITFPVMAHVKGFEDTQERPAPAAALLVDDITAETRGLQAAILSLIRLKKIGSTKFGRRVRLVAAANPVDSAAGGYALSAPAANRFVHLNFDLDIKGWRDWMLKGSSKSSKAQDPAALEKHVLDAWPSAFAGARATIASFINVKPNLLHKMPERSQRSCAWPSPRSWDLAARCLASAKIHGLDTDGTIALIGGCVGEAATTEFATWLNHRDLPDPVALLNGTVTWKPDPKRSDVTYSVLDSIVSLGLTDRSKLDKVWGIIHTVVKCDMAAAVPACATLVQSKAHMSTSAQKVLEDMAPMLASVHSQGK